MTGGDTHHYTTEDMQSFSENGLVTGLYDWDENVYDTIEGIPITNKKKLEAAEVRFQRRMARIPPALTE